LMLPTTVTAPAFDDVSALPNPADPAAPPGKINRLARGSALPISKSLLLIVMIVPFFVR
jgi:hypothetical protein